MDDHTLHAVRLHLLLRVPTSTRIANELGVPRHALDQRLSVHASYLPLHPSAISREAACLPLNDARRSQLPPEPVGSAGGNGAASSRGKLEEKRPADESGPLKGPRLLMEALRSWGVTPSQALAIGTDDRDLKAASKVGTLYIHAGNLSVLNPRAYLEYPRGAGAGHGQVQAPAPFDPALRGQSAAAVGGSGASCVWPQSR